MSAPNTRPNDASQVLLVPSKSVLLAGHDNQIRVLVRVQAPDQNPNPSAVRPPCSIAFVLDRSGSMSGTPLAEARNCVVRMLERMRPDDEAALVTFDNRVRVNVPRRLVGDRTDFLTALRSIESGGNTNLFGGWEAGSAELSGIVDQAGLRRVLILSDGNANEGVRETEAMAVGVSEAASRGISTSTYGLGRDFNEEMMIALGQAGGGNHYYGETAADLMDPFSEEFDLLADLFSRGITLSVKAADGAQIRLRNDYPSTVRPDGVVEIRLPDLAYGAEAWALFDVVVPQRNDMDTAAQSVMAVDVSGHDLNNVPVHFPPTALALPALSAPAWNAVASNELVARRDIELRAADLLKEAGAAARAGNFDEVARLIRRAKEEFADNPWVSGVLESLEMLQHDAALFSKSARYSALKMSRRLSEKEEFLVNDVAPPEGKSFLRRKNNEGRRE